MKLQIIEKDGRPEWAVLPYEDYQRLVETIRSGASAEQIRALLQRLESGEAETVPTEVASRLLSENPYLVWREHRGLSAEAVAQTAGITKAFLAMIEAGDAKPSEDVRTALARALHVAPAALG